MSKSILIGTVLVFAACGKTQPASTLKVDDPSKTYSLYASLSKDAAKDNASAYRVQVASPLNLDPNSVVFCLSTAEKCANDPTQARIAGVEQMIDGVKVFVTKSYIGIQHNIFVTITAKDTAGASHSQSIKITDPAAVQAQPLAP